MYWAITKETFYSATDNFGNQSNITCKEIVQQEVTRSNQMDDKKTPGMYSKYENLRNDILKVGLQILIHEIHKNLVFHLFRIFLFKCSIQEDAYSFFHSFFFRRYQIMDYYQKIPRGGYTTSTEFTWLAHMMVWILCGYLRYFQSMIWKTLPSWYTV